MTEPGERRRRVRPHPIETTAVPDPPLGDFLDDFGLPGDTAAGDTAEALVERDVDRVEEGGDLSWRPAIACRRLPEPGAVHVHRRPALAGPIRLSDEIVPRR